MDTDGAVSVPANCIDLFFFLVGGVGGVTYSLVVFTIIVSRFPMKSVKRC